MLYFSLYLDLDIGSVKKTFNIHFRIITSVARVIILRSNRRDCPRPTKKKQQVESIKIKKKTSSTQAGYSEESITDGGTTLYIA